MIKVVGDTAVVNPVKNISGEFSVPPDKSITHRSIMFASLSKGKSQILNYLTGDDCIRTIDIFKKMGVKIEQQKDSVVVEGMGLHNLNCPKGILYAGNSGTTMRLMSGILAGQPFNSEISGDESLSKRPMRRIMEPLRMMGAEIIAANGEYPPLKIIGHGSLKPVNYRLPVASAQVKSAIIFASLYSKGKTIIEEPVLSRDHTERMCNYFGLPLTREGNKIIIEIDGNISINARDIEIVNDFSSAAFFIVAALIIPGSKIKIKNIGINPTRTGMLEALLKMGANIKLENQRMLSGEPSADLTVTYSKLKSTEIKGEIIPRMIDEIPIFALAATQAEGETIISDAEELKFKESNRLETVTKNLTKLGAKVKILKDVLLIQGPIPLIGQEIESYGDHRIAMMSTIAGLAAINGETKINSIKCIETSFPGFWDILTGLTNG